MPSSKDYDRIPSVAVQPTAQFNTWDTTDEGNVMNINGNVTMGKPRTRSSRAERYGGQAPRSGPSQPAPVGSDRRGYSSRQPLGRQEAYSNSQGPSPSRNDVYPAMQQAQNVEYPHRVQSAPPVQNPNQSRFSRGTTTPLSYNPSKTDELSQYGPPPAALPTAQYSSPSSNQPSSSPTHISYLPPKTQELTYAAPLATLPTAQYSSPSSNQPSSSPNASAYRPVENDAPAAPQYIIPEPNSAFGIQQVSLPSTGWQPPPPFGASGGPSSFPGQTLASSASMGWQAASMGQASQTLASSESSLIVVDAQELTLLAIEEYLQNTHKTSRNDPATYLHAEEDYVKHILSKMASPTGNSFEKSQRTYASKVSKSVPKICARLFVYQLARIFFDGKADPRAIPFCDNQLQDWGRLDMTACLEEEGEIEEAIKMGYKPELQNEDVIDKITGLDSRATRLQVTLARGLATRTAT